MTDSAREVMQAASRIAAGDKKGVASSAFNLHVSRFLVLKNLIKLNSL